VFGIFIGHGIIAFRLKPDLVSMLIKFGFSEENAITVLPLIGMFDILIAFFALFWPARIVLIWASCWAFATALIRPLAGEPIWEFVERTGNWAVPLALLAMHGFPKKIKDLLSIR
jgi:hypothetical protein